MDRAISVSDVLTDAWDLAKRNFWILIGFTAVQFVIIFIITTLLTAVLGGASGVGVLVQNVLLSLVEAFLTVALYQAFFKLIDEPGDPDFPDFIPSLVKALNFLIVTLIICLVRAFLIAIISPVYFIHS